MQVSPELGEAMKALNRRPLIFTLCGSAKFEQEFHEWNRWLTFAGAIVISLAVFPSVAGSKDWYSKHQKAVLDHVHLQKISVANAVLVINKDGYIGESTMKEILFAIQTGKDIYSTEPLYAEAPKEKMISWASDAPTHIYRVDAFGLALAFKEVDNG